MGLMTLLMSQTTSVYSLIEEESETGQEEYVQTNSYTYTRTRAHTYRHAAYSLCIVFRRHEGRQFK
jgi:hypothetical protein